MNTPNPSGRYIYSTEDRCLVVVESTKNGWFWHITHEDSTPIRVGAHWPTKKRALEDIEKALLETSHPTELKQIAAKYTYEFDNFDIELRGNERTWFWTRGKEQGRAKSKSAALKAAMKGTK